MAANALQTDFHETRDLLGWRMVVQRGAGGAAGGWWLWRVRILPMRCLGRRSGATRRCASRRWRWWWRACWSSSRELAPLMRNHVHAALHDQPAREPSTRPAGWCSSRCSRTSRKLLPTSAGAALGASYAAAGEAAAVRGGGGRDGARRPLRAQRLWRATPRPSSPRAACVSWRNVHSCGTNTLASVPCMFSPLGKDGYESRKDDHENLLDVAQAAGLAVLWIDNQPGGCKGVCDRVPNADARRRPGRRRARPRCAATTSAWTTPCSWASTRRIEALPAERRAPRRAAGDAPDGQPRPGLLQALVGRHEALHARVHDQRAGRLQPRRADQRLRQLDRLHRPLPRRAPSTGSRRSRRATPPGCST